MHYLKLATPQQLVLTEFDRNVEFTTALCQYLYFFLSFKPNALPGFERQMLAKYFAKRDDKSLGFKLKNIFTKIREEFQ